VALVVESDISGYAVHEAHAAVSLVFIFWVKTQYGLRANKLETKAYNTFTLNYLSSLIIRSVCICPDVIDHI
jgi:hypothetical protein